MITTGAIEKQATADRVPAATVERDYVLAHVLSGIARQPDATRMIFKGGTALRLCYFDDYRYSADLDFSLSGGMTTEQARAVVLDSLAETAEQIGLPQLSFTDDESPRISYRGPLGRERYVKLDLADDELTDEPVIRPIIQRYEDQIEINVAAYSLEEVSAEKLRCIIQRVQCRDLFDLRHLLVDEGISTAEVWALFERKARLRIPTMLPLDSDGCCHLLWRGCWAGRSVATRG